MTSRPPAEDRLFYGYRLRSDLALSVLPELPMTGEPDIRLTLGEVPTALETPVWSSPFVQIDATGTALVRVDERLSFWIRDGRTVILARPPGMTAPEIEPFIYGIVAGLLFHQRGVTALHGSCIAIDGTAVVMTGPSGRGKSTLAAALSAAGHGVVADDVCRLEFQGDAVLAMPGPAQLRLWPDAARALGYDSGALAAGRSDHPKRVLMKIAPATLPTPLGAVIRLAVVPGLAAPMIEPIRGPAAIMPVEDLVYRARLGRHLGRRVGVFRDLAGLGSRIPVYRLLRPEGTFDLPSLVELVRSVVAR